MMHENCYDKLLVDIFLAFLVVTKVRLGSRYVALSAVVALCNSRYMLTQSPFYFKFQRNMK